MVNYQDINRTVEARMQEVYTQLQEQDHIYGTSEFGNPDKSGQRGLLLTVLTKLNKIELILEALNPEIAPPPPAPEPPMPITQHGIGSRDKGQR